ncbi:hypothetical protein MPTK1_4g15220 [Marchantia polymorpha subsp. ruderalis]|uniref:Protein FAR1-RELATED SEQUENCE n=2 Tax=Marchantia polymorpha TaxID=3197 RepID=A0AAF6BA48_MARPO|nr:hypothetical protein MARPO_0119s0046 [Marchantia polymorpha]BBN08882.1 hypothetical protein Mp_4g15220 [Marchantia polymorpha subsp. ruderalis]|eukprot:PTQ30848.1 hypothetical protein MARPO_0119s0046 [Marchantia polymorpha]
MRLHFVCRWCCVCSNPDVDTLGPPGKHIIARDIYNLKRQHRTEWLEGRMQTKALLLFMIELDVPNIHCVDASGHLTRLAFTNTKDVQLTRRFGTILIMECTYKMNMFKMHYFTLLALLALGQPSYRPLRFSVCSTDDIYAKTMMANRQTCFIEEDWQTFMTFFLAGHTSKHFPIRETTTTNRSGSVRARFRRSLDDPLRIYSSHYKQKLLRSSGSQIVLKMMRAGTKNNLQEKLVLIQTEWSVSSRVLCNMMQYKTYFVGAYVDKMPHFELSSSSRVECAHLVLKQHVSISDMMTMVELVLQFLAEQYQEINIAISLQKRCCNIVHLDMFND